MTKKYLLADETIDRQDMDALIGWLMTYPWLTQGPLVREFEEKWAKWQGVRFAVFVNSGSSANMLMYYALLVSGKLRNKKVIVPAVSWPTTVAPAIQFRFEPVMCEADRNTFGLDLNHLEDLLRTHRPAAVIAVHVLGVPNNMDELIRLQKQYDFVLMEDACAATGSTYRRKKVGCFGTLSSFSLFFGHHVSTIEGGMVCTDDEALYEILLQLRSHGWAKDLPKEKQDQKAIEAEVMDFNKPFTFYYPGFNVRSTDLNARIGISQMEKIDAVIERRIRNHQIYQSRFSGLPGFHCQTNPAAEISSIAFALLAPSAEVRSKIASILNEKGIETRPLGGGNMSRQPFWRAHFEAMDFPVADRIQETCFQLPNHAGLSTEDIHSICETVSTVETLLVQK